MATEKMTPEGAVRLYLMALANPDSLRDEAQVKKLTAEVEKAKDPISRLEARAALAEAEQVDPDYYKALFLTHAKDYCDSQGWSPELATSIFADEGVPADVIRAALGTKGKRSSKGGGGGKRAPRLSLEEVEKALPTGEFKLSDLAEKIDRPTATTRNYVKKLMEAGKVGEVGPDPDHDGRGKAAIIYTKA